MHAQRKSTPETVTIASKAGDEGKLFGSIGTRDIADAVTAAGVDVAKSEVRLPNGVLRTTGEHEVNFGFTAKYSQKLSSTWLLSNQSFSFLLATKRRPSAGVLL